MRRTLKNSYFDWEMKKLIENQANGLEAKYHKNVVETNAKNKKKKLFEESFKQGNKKNAKKSRTITTIVKMPNITQINVANQEKKPKQMLPNQMHYLMG